jgi:hypothetical protein
MSPNSRFAYSLAFLSAWAAAACVSAEPAKSPVDAKTAAAPHVLVTISKETTFVTGPLRSDGYVDYAGALNESWRQGVTPEINSAVLFWQAVGPAEITGEHRDQYFKLLGMPRPPEKGDYFIPLDTFIGRLRAESGGDASPRAKELDGALEFVEAGERRPWSKRDFPALADWLAANERPLALVVEASRRPRRYDPVISGKDTLLIATLLPAIQQSRRVANALAVRAMLRAGEGKIDAACDDLLAVHRLGRLASQGPWLIDGLVGVAIDGIADAGDQGLLQQGRMSAVAARKMLAKLDNLPRLFNTADKIDIGERFSLLDAVGHIARNGIDSLSALTGSGNGSPKTAQAKEISAAIAAEIDWDVVLRLTNSWYDRMVAAVGQPTRRERARATRAFDHELREMAANAQDWAAFIFPYLANPKKAVSQRVGAIFVALMLPAVDAASVAEDRGEMQFEITKLGYALAAYRAERGAYPAKLSEMVPKYMTAVPRDVFNNDELHYRVEGDGYLLYSVGMNGQDDGSRGYNDDKTGAGWDDLSLRVPNPTGGKRAAPLPP